MLYMDCPGLPTQEGCSSMWVNRPGAATSIGGDWSVRAIQVTHRRRTSSRRAYRTAEPDDPDVRRAGSYNALRWARSRMALDQWRSRSWDGRQARALEARSGLGGPEVKPAHAAAAGGPERTRRAGGQACEDRHGPRAKNVSLGADPGHVSDWGNGTFPVTAPTLLRAVQKRDRNPIPHNGSHDYI